MGGKSIRQLKKRKCYGNRFSTSNDVSTLVAGTSAEVMLTCCAKKLRTFQEHFREDTLDKKELTGFRIIDIEILISILSIFPCPECNNNGLYRVSKLMGEIFWRKAGIW
ncbi:hypothetical protein AVEN_239943-1 [Araneus ventricosus]|uniref:Uncharacterized protein n=1 Tax=Araneus ventricosus TaxID=182803 RepID=A0A4Y2W5D3_ARAVE|nr:hypothetical protein AVEN_239943-1 [Araneus ventricosus]